MPPETATGDAAQPAWEHAHSTTFEAARTRSGGIEAYSPARVVPVFQELRQSGYAQLIVAGIRVPC